MISKVRYKIEQYFGLTALYHEGSKASLTTLVKEGWDRIPGAIVDPPDGTIC